MSDKAITVKEAIGLFFAYPDLAGLAEATLRQKRRTLHHLVKMVGADTPTYALTYQQFADCMEDLRTGGTKQENEWRVRRGIRSRSGRSEVSMRPDRTVLLQFADFLRYNKFAEPDFYPLKRFTSSTKVASTDTKLPAPKPDVAQEDWSRLLDVAGEHHARSRIVAALGLFFGRRVSEVRTIQWKHVDLTNSCMTYVNVKRGKLIERKPFMLPLKLELERWHSWLVETYGEVQPDWYLIPVKVRPQNIADKDLYRRCLVEPSAWPLDLTRPAQALAITNDLQQALRAIGWQDVTGEGMHTLRRTHLRAWDEAGDMGAAQEAGDHSLRATTERYTGNLAARRAHAAKVVDQNPFGVTIPVPRTSDVIMVDFISRRKVS